MRQHAAELRHRFSRYVVDWMVAPGESAELAEAFIARAAAGQDVKRGTLTIHADLPVDPADMKQKIGVYQSADAHIMGRAAYEGMAGALPTADHPYSGIMNAARKVVFSRTRL